MAYLFNHTLNRNGTYTGGKRNPLPFDENIITDKSQQKELRDRQINTFFHSNPIEESVILNVQYTG